MKPLHFFLLLSIMTCLSVTAFGQVVEPEQGDDPFADDPFFTKPLKDWFGTEEIKERVRRTSDRIIVDRGIDEGSRDITGLAEGAGINKLNVVNPWFRYNRVEGAYLGFSIDERLRWGSRKDLRGFGSLGYSFGREEAQYSFGVERFFGYSRKLIFGVSYHKLIDSEDKWRVGDMENTVSALFAGFDHLDYFESQGIQVYTIVRLGDWVEQTLAYQDHEYKALQNVTRYSMFGKKSTFRENPTFDEGRAQAIIFGTSFNKRERALTPLFMMSGDILVELSDASTVKTDYDFRRYQAEIRTAFRIDHTALLQNRFRAGAITGNSPDFKEFSLGGISTLRARPYKYLTGTHMMLFNSELHLGRKVGNRHNKDRFDTAIDINNLKFTIFADLGWTQSQITNKSNVFEGFDSFSFSNVYSDAGVSVNFNLIRVEAAWPTDNFSQTPVIWFRLNSTF